MADLADWYSEQQQSQGPKIRYLWNCKSSLVLEHGYTTATVWSARVDRSTVGLDSWSMGLAEVIQVPGVGHRSGMGSWITGWKAVFQAQWARCKSMVGPSPNSGTRGHGTEEKQCNGRSKIWVRTLGSGTKSSCSAACDVGQNPDLRPKGGMQSREILVLVMARQSHNLRPERLAWRSICCLIDDEAQWHPVIGEQSTAVTSAPVGRSTYRERAPAPRGGREEKKWGFWVALSTGLQKTGVSWSQRLQMSVVWGLLGFTALCSSLPYEVSSLAVDPSWHKGALDKEKIAHIKTSFSFPCGSSWFISFAGWLLLLLCSPEIS